MVYSALNAYHFQKKICQLQKLREYLAGRVGDSLADMRFLKKVVHEGIGLRRRGNEEWYYGLGEYLTSLGGISSFLRKPIYTFSPTLAVTAYLEKCRDNKPDFDVKECPSPIALKLTRELYNDRSICLEDTRMMLFRRFCRRSDYQIAKKMIEVEMNGPMTSNLIKSIKNVIINYIEQESSSSEADVASGDRSIEVARELANSQSSDRGEQEVGIGERREAEEEREMEKNHGEVERGEETEGEGEKNNEEEKGKGKRGKRMDKEEQKRKSKQMNTRSISTRSQILELLEASSEEEENERRVGREGEVQEKSEEIEEDEESVEQRDEERGLAEEKGSEEKEQAIGEKEYGKDAEEKDESERGEETRRGGQEGEKEQENDEGEPRLQEARKKARDNDFKKRPWSTMYRTGDAVTAKYGKYDWMSGRVSSTLKGKVNVRFGDDKAVYAIRNKNLIRKA